MPPCITRSDRTGLVELRLELDERSHHCCLSRVSADCVRVHVVGLMASDAVHEELFELFHKVGAAAALADRPVRVPPRARRARPPVQRHPRAGRCLQALHNSVCASCALAGCCPAPRRRLSRCAPAPPPCRHPQVLNVRLSALDIRRTKSSRNRILTVDGPTPEEVFERLRDQLRKQASFRAEKRQRRNN